MRCYNCGNKFIPSPTFEVEEGWQLCCVCWYQELVDDGAPDEVFQALQEEVNILLNGVEGDFERIKQMEYATDEECNDSYEISKCGQKCAYYETCPWNDVYTLPTKEVI